MMNTNSALGVRPAAAQILYKKPRLEAQDLTCRHKGATSINRRQTLLAVPITSVTILQDYFSNTFPSKAATSDKQMDPKFLAAFNKALQDSGDGRKAEASWSAVIELDPTNSYAWSNRGTVRLQQGSWQGAKDDLEKALELEQTNDGVVSGILLNNLGNAEGALGDWTDAIEHFKAASLDPDVTPIALANLALAQFQTGETEEGVKLAQSLLRRDPNFLDMRCALTAMLWASGKEAEAESEWGQLQSTNDGLGGLIYRRDVAIKRVQGRWPPRAVAALDAFLKLSRIGESLDYDRKKKSYRFVNNS